MIRTIRSGECLRSLVHQPPVAGERVAHRFKLQDAHTAGRKDGLGQRYPTRVRPAHARVEGRTWVTGKGRGILGGRRDETGGVQQPEPSLTKPPNCPTIRGHRIG
jgi:hypothetical protein